MTVKACRPLVIFSLSIKECFDCYNDIDAIRNHLAPETVTIVIIMIYCLISADIPFTQSYQSSQRSLRVVLNYERYMNKGFLITYK